MFRGLSSSEFTCHLVVPAEPPLRAEFERAGVTVHIVPMERISTSHGARGWLRYATGWPVAVARLARLIRRLDIDVVHTNSLHSWYGWAAAYLTRRPHVWHAREIAVQSNRALTLERFLTRHFATTVICMSQAIADQLPDAPTIVIRESVDHHEFRPGLAGRFRAGAGIADDVFLFGAAGRVDTWKGFDVLLEAFADASAGRDDMHLAVVGGPVRGKEALFEQLECRAAAIPNAHWLGPRTDMPEFLADLDGFALPSTEPEPYGLVIVEALASGVPAVVTDAGGPPEIAADAEPGSVLLVPPSNPALLADAMLKMAGAASGSSAEQRRNRTPLHPERRDPFSAIFRDARS